MQLIQKNDIILFQGDSITDCGRDRSNLENMGNGYPRMLDMYLKSEFPDFNLKLLNLGISGSRVRDLAMRWQADCLDLTPTLLSVLIGINDTWRRYDQNSPTSAEEYERGLDAILTQARDQYVSLKIVVMEPFLMPYPADKQGWREDLDPKIMAARRVAKRHGAIYVPLDGLFASACMHTPDYYWSADGVHPTQAGHGLIARAWLRAVCGGSCEI